MIISGAKGLRKQWQALIKQNPKKRIRDCAKLLNVREAELVATGVGKNSVRLSDDWPKLLSQLSSLGVVMALTRNDSVVHERHGIYQAPRLLNNGMALFVNDDIDLRIFLSHWAFGFAVKESNHNREDRYSLQFFDHDGQAVHKIYLTQESDKTAFDQLVDQHAAVEQMQPLEFSLVEEHRYNTSEEKLDIKGFQQAWDELKDTHDFLPLLKEFKIDRQQALQLAGPSRSRELTAASINLLMRHASQAGIEVMVFVASPGVIQIHTGKIKRIITAGDWLNVLDPSFNLHIRESDIYSCWSVAKPSVDGQVTSVECFDHQGKTIVQFFGKRKPGQKENPFWRALVETLPSA